MELVKKGKRLYGAFLESGTTKYYCAFRSAGDLFLDGKSSEFISIADAIASGRAAWAIDEETLRAAKRREVEYIGVYVRKMKWLFITPLANYFDGTMYYRRNYTSRGGSEQRYLSTDHFIQKTTGTIIK